MVIGVVEIVGRGLGMLCSSEGEVVLSAHHTWGHTRPAGSEAWCAGSVTPERTIVVMKQQEYLV